MGKHLCAALITCVLAPQDGALQRFQEAIDAYVALHRNVERQAPRQEISPDAEEIHRAIDAMADALKASRPAAAEGDIFRPAAMLLRLRIRTTIHALGHNPADIRSWMTGNEPVPDDAPLPAVNGPFSWALPSFMLPAVLAALPPLPAELEYRFVGRDLVLIDVDADLVVDILRDAFPDRLDPALADAYLEV